MTGRPMKGWVLVAPEGVKTKRELGAWVQRGLGYARSLPPRGLTAAHEGPARLRARIAIVVVAGAIVVAVGLALLLSNTISLRNNSDATIRDDTYLLRVTDVERVVINAETGLRGYIITDRHEFLSRWRPRERRFRGQTISC